MVPCGPVGEFVVPCGPVGEFVVPDRVLAELVVPEFVVVSEVVPGEFVVEPGAEVVMLGSVWVSGPKVWVMVLGATVVGGAVVVGFNAARKIGNDRLIFWYVFMWLTRAKEE